MCRQTRKLRTLWSQTSGRFTGSCALPVPHHQVFIHTLICTWFQEPHPAPTQGPTAARAPAPRVGQPHGPDDSQEGPGQKQLPALAPRGSRGCGTTELRESPTSRHTYSHPHPHPGIGLEEVVQLPHACRLPWGGWGWGATSSVTSGLGLQTRSRGGWEYSAPLTG